MLALVVGVQCVYQVPMGPDGGMREWLGVGRWGWGHLLLAVTAAHVLESGLITMN